MSQKLRHRDYLCILWSVYSLLKVITLIWKGTYLDNILKSTQLVSCIYRVYGCIAQTHHNHVEQFSSVTPVSKMRGGRHGYEERNCSIIFYSKLAI